MLFIITRVSWYLFIYLFLLLYIRVLFDWFYIWMVEFQYYNNIIFLLKLNKFESSSSCFLSNVLVLYYVCGDDTYLYLKLYLRSFSSLLSSLHSLFCSCCVIYWLIKLLTHLSVISLTSQFVYWVTTYIFEHFFLNQKYSITSNAIFMYFPEKGYCKPLNLQTVVHVYCFSEQHIPYILYSSIIDKVFF